MTITREEIDNLGKRLSDLHDKLKPEDLYKQKAELEKESIKPDFWQNEASAKKTMQEIASLGSLLSDLAEADENLNSFVELNKMRDESSDKSLDIELEKLLRTINKQLDKLELFTYLSGKYDPSEAILSVHSGQGGTEAMDWASMVSRMYTRYFERKTMNQ